MYLLERCMVLLLPCWKPGTVEKMRTAVVCCCLAGTRTVEEGRTKIRAEEESEKVKRRKENIMQICFKKYFKRGIKQ